MTRPILIGVTGGIGAGKSTLVDAFVHRGAVPFSADSAVHELYGAPDVVEAVRERWGEDVIVGGVVARNAIASIVFTDDAELRWLEGLLHPRVGVAWLAFVDEQRALPEPPEFVVAEVPLLFEAGLEDRYDAVVAVTAPLPTRIERANARDDGKAHSVERAAAQMDEAEKTERADISFINTGSFEELDAFAGRVLDELRAKHGV
ncbi:MAG: dephospho-CoA kinase [Thermoleophilia bacterium]|nr:dephospho-CoA kinase [Thermoleophilia bacterium]